MRSSLQREFEGQLLLVGTEGDVGGLGAEVQFANLRDSLFTCWLVNLPKGLDREFYLPLHTLVPSVPSVPRYIISHAKTESRVRWNSEFRRSR